MCLQETIGKIKKVDTQIMAWAQDRVDHLIKPKRSLGDLEDIYVKVAGITGKKYPMIEKKSIIVMAGDHGIIEEGVATSEKDITKIQAINMTRGFTGVCALAKQARAQVVVVDIGIDNEIDTEKIVKRKIRYGAGNFLKGLAMEREEAIKALEVGIEMAEMEIQRGVNLLGTGEMGIGNTTPSAAIVSVISGESPLEVTGIGANLPAERVKHKAKVIEAALKKHTPDPTDAIDILSKVGGLEIAGMAGVMLGGAANGVPVIVDGFISTAAALIACTLEPKVKDYLIPSHASMEKGARIASEILGFKPPLNLDLRLGEGTGAAIMMNVVESALYMNKEMLTFEEAGFIVD